MQVPVTHRSSAHHGACSALFLACCVLWAPACKRQRSTPVTSDGVLADDAAGKACKRDADCEGGVCTSALHIVAADSAITAAGGYCTRRCEADSECGALGLCNVPAGETHGECLAQCSGDRACREGYQCVGASPGFGLAGTCQPSPETDKIEDGVVGSSCEGNEDCGGGLCVGQSPVGESLPENYCSGRCLRDEDCGAGGGCLTFEGSGRPGSCLQRCESDDECERPGYRCRTVGVGFQACYPAPQALADHHVGKACEQAEECGGERALCAHTLPYFGGLDHADAPDGYCTQACSTDSDCGQGGQCISRGPDGALCFAVCQEQEDCRQGYECVVHGRDHDDSERICVPWT